MLFIWYLVSRYLYACNCSCEHSLGIIRDIAVDVISSGLINKRCKWIGPFTFKDIQTNKKFKLKDVYTLMPFIYKQTKHYRNNNDDIIYARMLRDKYNAIVSIIGV